MRISMQQGLGNAPSYYFVLLHILIKMRTPRGTQNLIMQYLSAPTFLRRIHLLTQWLMNANSLSLSLLLKGSIVYIMVMGYNLVKNIYKTVHVR